jgi:TRAP-type C4-dicarboxylate transport system permease large subunit
MVVTYSVYLALSLIITVWVGHTLHKNGRIFLVENFEGKEALADSVNHLLLVGFYLVNAGFVSLALRYGGRPEDLVDSIEYLSTKVGLVIVVLGVMHFFNMIWLSKFRRSWLFEAIDRKRMAA